MNRNALKTNIESKLRDLCVSVANVTSHTSIKDGREILNENLKTVNLNIEQTVENILKDFDYAYKSCNGGMDGDDIRAIISEVSDVLLLDDSGNCDASLCEMNRRCQRLIARTCSARGVANPNIPDCIQEPKDSSDVRGYYTRVLGDILRIGGY
jgi:hypothetical protein